MTYCETSAKSGIGVKEAFEGITKDIVKIKLENMQNQETRDPTIKLHSKDSNVSLSTHKSGEISPSDSKLFNDRPG